MAISGDGITIGIDGYLTDPLLNPKTTPAYIDWETWFPTAAIGQKLNQNGSIMFQPLTEGIDMIARNTGRLLYRVQISGTASNVYDSLVVANGTNTLVVITTAGVSLVDLSSLPIPSEDSQPFPNMRNSEAHGIADSRNSMLSKPMSSNCLVCSINSIKKPRLKSRVAFTPSSVHR